MALITRCPVCGTQFKVVPDQLRISEGWVRCGQCAEVFDASHDLHQGEMAQLEPPVPAAAEAAPILDVESVESPVALADPPATPYLSPAVPESFTNYLHPAPVLSPVLEEPEADMQADEVLPEAVVAQDVLDAPPEEALVATAEEVLSEPEPVAEHGAAAAEEVPPPMHFEPEPSAELLAENYSFARVPPPASQGRLRFERWGGLTAVGLLGVLLGVQMLLFGRDRIAASWPISRPLLQSTCELLGCRVQALRHIESIAIDSSSLSVGHNDAYHLSLVLKNHAMVDLAMPALEFVLTDGDEQALFRRVLMPADFGGASRLLFAGREWATTIDLQVQDGPMKSRIVGYRLLAFYP